MNILNKLTNECLKLNKKRTIVTIIGIILSGAMISAVTTLAVSFQDYLIRAEKLENGDWESRFENVTYQDIKYIENNDNFKDKFLSNNAGMAKINFAKEEYMHIKAYEKDGINRVGLKIEKGRLPENENEIALSETVIDGLENEPKIGDEITVDLGRVFLEGEDITYQTKIICDEFKKEETKTYKVCGIIERPQFEGESQYTAGVTILNRESLKNDENIDIYVTANKTKQIYIKSEEVAEKLGLFTILEDGTKKYDVKYNRNVLNYMGISDDSGFTESMLLVCGILILVIGIGSIVVIYNSFAISVSERKKQFGMLSSIGATKKQIKKSVLHEGIILGSIGIPLGILSGILGIGITLKIVGKLLETVVNNLQGVELKLIISVPAIIIAVILIAITIFLSVIIPARRASKTSPIDAIRQSDDIKIKNKKLKTPKFIEKICGVEGTIALKNLKRSKKKYRTTVISLTISVILYITVSGFTGYMFEGFDELYKTIPADISISEYSKNGISEIATQLDEIQGFESYIRISSVHGNLYITKDNINSETKKELEKNNKMQDLYLEENGKIRIGVSLSGLDKKTYEEFLKKENIDELKDNEVILYDYVNGLRTVGAQYYITNYKQDDKLVIEQGNTQKEEEFIIKKVIKEAPLGIENYNGITLIANENTIKRLQKENEYMYNTSYIQLSDENKQELKIKVEDWKNKYKNNTIIYVDIEEEIKSTKNLKLIIQIFLYGFIVLISLIGISNIFNTISTNIALRRREFANLKSIGMTDKQFRKMLDLECIFYGTKSLLYGIPLGIIICIMMNKSFDGIANFLFILPWFSIITSIIAVYLVVFITMMYSSRKVKKENIIDILRDDNI